MLITKAAGFQKKRDESEYERHLKMLEVIKQSKSNFKSIDNFPEELSKIKANNTKFIQNEKLLTIYKDNQILLEKLIEISSKKNSLSPSSIRNSRSDLEMQKTLHAPFRKKQMIKIAEENEALAKRLLVQQPALKLKKLEKDFEMHETFLKNCQKIKKLPPLSKDDFKSKKKSKSSKKIKQINTLEDTKENEEPLKATTTTERDLISKTMPSPSAKIQEPFLMIDNTQNLSPKDQNPSLKDQNLLSKDQNPEPKPDNPNTQDSHDPNAEPSLQETKPDLQETKPELQETKPELQETKPGPQDTKPTQDSKLLKGASGRGLAVSIETKPVEESKMVRSSTKVLKDSKNLDEPKLIRSATKIEKSPKDLKSSDDPKLLRASTKKLTTGTKLGGELDKQSHNQQQQLLDSDRKAKKGEDNIVMRKPTMKESKSVKLSDKVMVSGEEGMVSGGDGDLGGLGNVEDNKGKNEQISEEKSLLEKDNQENNPEPNNPNNSQQQQQQPSQINEEIEDKLNQN